MTINELPLKRLLTAGSPYQLGEFIITTENVSGDFKTGAVTRLPFSVHEAGLRARLLVQVSQCWDTPAGAAFADDGMVVNIKLCQRMPPLFGAPVATNAPVLIATTNTSALDLVNFELAPNSSLGQSFAVGDFVIGAGEHFIDLFLGDGTQLNYVRGHVVLELYRA